MSLSEHDSEDQKSSPTDLDDTSKLGSELEEGTLEPMELGHFILTSICHYNSKNLISVLVSMEWQE